MQYLVSICIPAYKRISFVKKLLDSIATQTSKNFEVIVTDDSPDNGVKELCQEYSDKYPLYYYRNQSPLGTPENWNEAIRRANGQWIKLMHDDDWFTDEQSLARFEAAVQKNPSTSFIFSAYRNIFLDENRSQEVFVNSFRFWLLRLNPVTLLSQNIIGPPSVVMHKNEGKFFYDPKLKWLVDIDFYIRYFKNERPLYIPEVSVNVGIGSEQVTRDCFGQRPVEIPENFHLLQKTGIKNLRNIVVYDAWWRLMRNLEITNAEDIRSSGFDGKIPPAVLSMIRWQAALPRWCLQTGILSKTLMFFNFLFNFFNIRG